MWFPHTVLDRYEGQRDMLYNQTFNLDQVAFAAEGIKDAQQTVRARDLPVLILTFRTIIITLLKGSFGRSMW